MFFLVSLYKVVVCTGYIHDLLARQQLEHYWYVVQRVVNLPSRHFFELLWIHCLQRVEGLLYKLTICPVSHAF